MLIVNFQLALMVGKKQSPECVLRNGSPKDFKENSNDNACDGLFFCKVVYQRKKFLKSDVHEVSLLNHVSCVPNVPAWSTCPRAKCQRAKVLPITQLGVPTCQRLDSYSTWQPWRAKDLTVIQLGTSTCQNGCQFFDFACQNVYQFFNYFSFLNF